MGRTYKVRIGNFKIGFRWWFQRVYDRVGVTNQTRDGFYVPFFDFVDNPPTSLSTISVAMMDLQKEWNLGDVYVVQSWPHESYRAFAFDKCNFRELLGILSGCPFIDENYLRSFARRKKSVLRVIPKKERGDHDKIVDIIPNFGAPRLRSFEHEHFFKKLFFGRYEQSFHDIAVVISKYESFR